MNSTLLMLGFIHACVFWYQNMQLREKQFKDDEKLRNLLGLVLR